MQAHILSGKAPVTQELPALRLVTRGTRSSITREGQESRSEPHSLHTQQSTSFRRAGGSRRYVRHRVTRVRLFCCFPFLFVVHHLTLLFPLPHRTQANNGRTVYICDELKRTTWNRPTEDALRALQKKKVRFPRQ